MAPAANAPAGEEPWPYEGAPAAPSGQAHPPATEPHNDFDDGTPAALDASEAGAPMPQRRQLHPLPPGLVELYGLLAVLFVLVPEWMAGGALLGLRFGRDDADLPVSSAAWRRLPELRLATLSLAELRRLAQQERLAGYARMERERLTERLLQRLQRRSRAAKPL
ncbi:MAG: hypothetical protein VKJ05_02750 [Synechococcaceae cyanobacterium]|nr:hypothetical protein [Synechococcaceae cyanobacterium]